MDRALRGFWQRLFNIYPSERPRALIFAFLGFIWAFGATCALKFADALFLLHVGADALPQAYTYIACGMFVLALVLLYSFHHFSSYRIYLTVLTSGMGFYLFALICLTMNRETTSPWLWYALKLAGFFLFAVLMTCYWTFIDQYHHLQDAKRLYTLFSSTIFLGATSTGFIMQSGWLDLEHLILLIIGLLGLSYGWVRKIAREIPPIAPDESLQEPPQEKKEHYVKFFLQSILASPFTLLLMANNLLIYLLLVITEYNYMLTFGNHFAAHPGIEAGGGTEANLTLFLGRCLATVSASNLIFGLFIYGRLVRNLGLNKLLLVTPMLLMIAFTGWSLSENLLFPLLGFFVVEGTLYVIDDSNFNLLLNVVPAKLKYKIRVIIESFFEPIGMLISAVLLTFLHDYTKLLGLILALLTLCVATALSANYLNALFFNLSNGALRLRSGRWQRGKEIADGQKKEAEERLFLLLHSEDEWARLLACEGLLAMEDPEILEALMQRATSMSESMKLKFIALVEPTRFAHDAPILDAFQMWAEQARDPELISALHFHLAKYGRLHPEQLLNELESSDLRLRGAALIALKYSAAHLPPSRAIPHEALLAHHLEQLLQSEHRGELCMGLQILGTRSTAKETDRLIAYLQDESAEVVHSAAKAIARSGLSDPPRQFSPFLAQLGRIGDHAIRLSCLKSLEKIELKAPVEELIRASWNFRPGEQRAVVEVIVKMGPPAVPSLLSVFALPSIPERCRLLAGRILERMAPLQLKDHLQPIMRQDIERAYHYLYHYHALEPQSCPPSGKPGQSEPGREIHLLREILIEKYRALMDFIVQVLSLPGEGEYGELLSRSLREGNPKMRSQVVEALEKTCDPFLFKLLRPLIDERPYEEKIREVLGKCKPNSSILNDLLAKLNASSDRKGEPGR